MEALDFLSSVKAFTEEALKDARCPVRPQKASDETILRPPTVYRMRMPDMGASEKKAPYVLQQIVTTDDLWPVGERAECSCLLRTFFCVWYPPGEDGEAREDEGQMLLFEIMQRYRIALLKTQILDNRYRLDLRKEPLEGVYYADRSAPYYLGEFASTWQIPAVEWNDMNGFKAGGYSNFKR